MPKITKALVDSLKPEDTEKFAWDAELEGFGVRVAVSGRKTYVVRYRLLDGTQRKQKLARCGDIPPDKARDMARKIFASVAEGQDPLQERATKRGGDTMQGLKDRYMVEHANVNKKPASILSDEQNWKLHILPFFDGGARKVVSVTKSDISILKGSLSTKRATANQCIALLSKALNLAEEWGMRGANTNPCRGVKKYTMNERELILSPAQIGKLDATLDAMLARGAIMPEFAGFIRLLMLTGCRKSEIMLSRKDWIDIDRRLLLLPDSKTGQRWVNLPDVAIPIIEKMLQTRSEWLVPGRTHGQPLKTPYKVWNAVKAEAELPAKLRLHDLRHTAGSLAHMAGATQREIADMLGHAQLSTTERYLHGHAGAGAKTANKLSEAIASNWAKQPVAA